MKRAESSPHPLFHSLVMMGGTVAVACGGVTSGSGGTGIGQSGAGGGGTGPGTGGAGGTPGTGGSVETGGVAATGGTSAVHIWPCPPAQLVCDQATSDAMACGSVVAPEPGGCICDSTRPLTADECPRRASSSVGWPIRTRREPSATRFSSSAAAPRFLPTPPVARRCSILRPTMVMDTGTRSRAPTEGSPPCSADARSFI